MTTLEKLQRNWEGLAQADPLHAICTDPEKKGRRWNKEELFATGRNEMVVVLGYLADRGLRVDRESAALDFGCGVGRLTQAMARYFPECWGVDISPTMVRLAQEFNHEVPQCRFLLNANGRLDGLSDNYFGFIYSSIVLQHIARKYAERYIRELIRVLKPGGTLVFQIPDGLRENAIKRLRVKLALRLRMESLIGISTPHRMEMHCIPERRIVQLAAKSGAEVIDVRITNSADPAFCGNLQYLEREPDSGYVSKQYCVVKPGGSKQGRRL